jgi:hypothetical protein
LKLFQGHVGKERIEDIFIVMERLEKEWTQVNQWLSYGEYDLVL